MTTSLSRISFLLGVSAVMLSSCKKDDDASPNQPLQATTFKNLPADPITVSPTGQPGAGTNKYTFFSFKTGAIIPNADSATNQWDLGFRGTTLIVNGGNSGPGQGGAIVQTGLFNDIVTAPETGYAVDSPTAKAIPTGSGNGWYNYDGNTNLISPIAGKVLLIRTGDGKYAKAEIISYYKDAPTNPAATDPSRYYTFRYLYQPDGSKNLK
jgi:hypothetical protein